MFWLMQLAFAFVMALLCSFAFFVLLILFRRSANLYVHSNMTLFLSLAVICAVRPLAVYEPPFTTVIVSTVIYPAIISTFSYPLFTISTATITPFVLFVAAWICGIFAFSALHIARSRGALRYIQALQTVKDERIEKMLHQLVQATRPKAAYRLIVSPQVYSPAVFGVFNPTIIMPTTEFSDEELEVVLRHEWSHFIHMDNLVRSIITGISIVLWWFPFLHFLNKETAEAQEYISDVRAVRDMAEKERNAYILTSIEITTKINRHRSEYEDKKYATAASNYTGIDSSMYIRRLEGLSTYSAKTGRTFKTIAATAVILVLLASYLFILQPAYEPDDGSSVVNFEASYLVPRDDGMYDLYLDGVYKSTVSEDRITEPPFSLFPIAEQSD